MKICLIGNETNTIDWNSSLQDKDIVVRIFPNVFDSLYSDEYFNKEHHAIINGLYNDETTFDLLEFQREYLKKFHKIKFINVNRDKDLVNLANYFSLESFRHLARDTVFFSYINEMESRFKNKFSTEIKTLLYYCHTYKDDYIHTYRFGFKNKKNDREKEFINNLRLNHISHD
jgi:hypothetical protein